MQKRILNRNIVSRALIVSLFCLTLSLTGYGQEIRGADEPSAYVQSKKCTNATPKGTYGFYGNGTFLPGNPDGEIAGPYTTIGLIKFDGDGHFTVPAETETFNGQPAVDPPFGGTYTVKADCAFTAANQFGGGFAGVIVDDGNEIYLMATDPGVVLNFVLKRR